MVGRNNEKSSFDYQTRGRIPFTKRPTGSFCDLVNDAQCRYPGAALIVAGVDDFGHIQVEPVQDVLAGHSAIVE